MTNVPVRLNQLQAQFSTESIASRLRAVFSFPINENRKNTMSAEAGAGGAFLIKSGLLVGLMSTMAAALGFAVAWPESGREAFYRFTSAFIGSLVLGVPLACVAWHNWPWMFTEMVTLVISFCASFHVGVSETEARFLGVLLAACPFLFAGALPFWWLSRAAVLWLVKRKGKDIGQLVEDGVRTYRRLQP